MKIESVSNFRELGGYCSEDGRIVKKNLFFRSGALGEVTKEDLQRLSELKLQVILDFRSKNEVRQLPDPEISGAVYYNVCALLEDDGKEKDFSPTEMEEMFRHKETLLLNIETTLRRMYGRMPFGNHAYRKMFDEMEKGNVPMLFHCSAGKDRTGVAAMLILLALGVIEEQILDDYEMTNQYRKDRIEKIVEDNKQEMKQYPELKTVFEVAEGVRRSTGEYVLELIKENYGSYERYFEKEFGLTAEKRKKLQDMYLQN